MFVGELVDGLLPGAPPFQMVKGIDDELSLVYRLLAKAKGMFMGREVDALVSR